MIGSALLLVFQLIISNSLEGLHALSIPLNLLTAHISEPKNDKICLLIKNGGEGNYREKNKLLFQRTNLQPQNKFLCVHG